MKGYRPIIMKFVVNRETVRRLGLEDPIGADVAIWGISRENYRRG